MRKLVLFVVIIAAVFGIYYLSTLSDDLRQTSDRAENTSSTAATESRPDRIRSATQSVNGARIINADTEPQNWLSHGRTYDEARFSPLKQINTDNVQQLGLAWYFDTNTDRGLEATPIVVDGVMFSTGSWSVVFANDARTGELIWQYDPQVPKQWGVKACCDVVNRGVALWEGKVFVGTIDGRLIALDAATGAVVWEVNTIDSTKPYTITGAPRVVNGKVIIGNGGAEMGVRGYVTAYDTSNGAQVWRFYTVPGNPADGFESDALKMAADTWHGEWWKIGGGGTAWDAMAYDPELNYLYIGVGNGSPWDRDIRSPGGGDNLFLSSIVAVNADTGEYVWHYQTTPGESWDYTATQHMILADLDINGSTRKVIMQAPKNGFFYVIDRTNGELISAKNYINISWATHVDMETGRPVETANARYQSHNPLVDMPPVESLKIMKSMAIDDISATLSHPGPLGGHNWHPMSYSPLTGLVYIPAMDVPFSYGKEPKFTYKEGRWNLAMDNRLNMPTGDQELDQAIAGLFRGHIAAWNPITQKEEWRVQLAGPWNGGVLTTAGKLLFQGNSSGQFVAYRADNGESLWSAPTQTGVVAPPVTYEVDREQYVTVMAGWGGAYALAVGNTPDAAVKPRGRILTFKLGGGASLPPLPTPANLPPVPQQTASDEQILNGKVLYHNYCGVCHGPGAVSGGVIADLRHMGDEKFQLFNDIVIGGAFQSMGMVSFADVLTEQDAADIKAYVLNQAQALRDSL